MGLKRRLQRAKEKQQATKVTVVIKGEKREIELPVICENIETLNHLLTVLAEQCRGKVYNTTILHDDDCTPEQCVCSPTYLVEDFTQESFDRSQDAQRKWVRSKSRKLN